VAVGEYQEPQLQIGGNHTAHYRANTLKSDMTHIPDRHTSIGSVEGVTMPLTEEEEEEEVLFCTYGERLVT
jgi:hypothetical protein